MKRPKCNRKAASVSLNGAYKRIRNAMLVLVKGQYLTNKDTSHVQSNRINFNWKANYLYISNFMIVSRESSIILTDEWNISTWQTIFQFLKLNDVDPEQCKHEHITGHYVCRLKWKLLHLHCYGACGARVLFLHAQHLRLVLVSMLFRKTA